MKMNKKKVTIVIFTALMLIMVATCLEGCQSGLKKDDYGNYYSSEDEGSSGSSSSSSGSSGSSSSSDSSSSSSSSSSSGSTYNPDDYDDYDTNNDGKADWHDLDTNNDGDISQEEFDKYIRDWAQEEKGYR